MASITAQKRLLRTDAAARRATAAKGNDIGASLVEIFDRAVAPPSGAVISGYMPMRSEANVLPLLQALQARGYSLALPVTPERGQPLVFRHWHEGETLDKGPLGTLQPAAGAPAVHPDIVLTPLLAFDRAGNRLGYGGGYYDRTIRAVREHRPVYAIGIAYAAQEEAAVPHDDGDTPLDLVVTEAGAIEPIRGQG